MKLDPGERFPDLDLPDHTGRPRRLSELSGGDRVVTELQDEFEVAYTRIVVVSIDAPEVQAASAPGLGARFVFPSDAERRWLVLLDLLEEADTVHRPYRPTAFTLYLDLTIHAAYDGNCYWGRPSSRTCARTCGRSRARCAMTSGADERAARRRRAIGLRRPRPARRERARPLLHG